MPKPMISSTAGWLGSPCCSTSISIPFALIFIALRAIYMPGKALFSYKRRCLLGDALLSNAITIKSIALCAYSMPATCSIGLKNQVTAFLAWYFACFQTPDVMTSCKMRIAWTQSACETYSGAKPKRKMFGARKSPITPRSITACMIA